MTHVGRLPTTRQQALAEGWFEPNDSGLCQCGCGQETSRAQFSLRKSGWVRGEFLRYRQGHAPQRGERNPYWKGDETGYAGLHSWLNNEYPRTGQCEDCAVTGRTEYALIAAAHVRDRAAYRELCVGCHRQMDLGCGKTPAAKLTPEAVRVIRRAEGRSDRDLAAEFSVSPSAIWQVRKGLSWTGVQ